jgi:hypothetical protein
MHLTDAALADLTRSLAETLGTTTGWDGPPTLYGLLPGCSAVRARAILTAAGDRWLRLAAGDPYRFLDTVRVGETDAAVLALAAGGWAVPPDQLMMSRGRPGSHPQRIRVGTLTLVTPDRRQCSAIHRRDTDEVIIDGGGEGPLLRALHAVWCRPGESGSAPGPPPAA